MPTLIQLDQVKSKENSTREIILHDELSNIVCFTIEKVFISHDRSIPVASSNSGRILAKLGNCIIDYI